MYMCVCVCVLMCVCVCVLMCVCVCLCMCVWRRFGIKYNDRMKGR